MPGDDTPAAVLSAIVEEAAGQSLARFALRHPGRVLDAARALAALPRVRARLTRDVEGLVVAKWLARSFPLRTPLHELTAVLELPPTLAEYTDVPGKQTLRRKVREATKLGVTWRLVEDDGEKRDLLRLAEEQERAKTEDPSAVPDHSELLEIGLWLTATAADGRPLMVAVAPVSREWAILRYFWVLGEGKDASASRYLMTQVLAEQLIRRGVRYLADPVTPLRLSSGLRQFQTMTGFTLIRVAAPRPSAAQLRRAGLTWEK